MNFIGGLLLVWLLILGFALVFRGERGAGWWIRTTGRFLRWFAREVLVSAGRIVVWCVSSMHQALVARWPTGTYVAYGLLTILLVLALLGR